jgi:DNA-binding NarL/FixJ family response regulator
MSPNDDTKIENGIDAKHTVLLVDDHPVIREGLTVRINREADFAVCGTAEDCVEAMAAIGKLKPDIVVMDLGLPRGHGLELMQDIHAQYPRLLVVIFSMQDEAVYAERALRAGARGYLMKHESSQRLLDGMRTVLRGGYALSRATSDRLLSAFAGPASEQSQSPVAGLGNRELEVFQFIGRGKGTKEIANLLNLSVKTVETYRERLKKKLNASSSPELTRRAVLWVETNG